MTTLLAPDAWRQLALELMAPPAASTAWDWCTAHLHLRTGQWDPARAGIMRHWFEIVTARITGQPLPQDPWAHRCEELWLVTIAQLAKTTFMLSQLAWVLAEHPREIAWYVTRGKDAAKFRRRSILPMIELTAPLERLLPRSLEARDHALGVDMLTLGGSLLYLLNGNLVDDVRSLPLPLIAIDEFDQLVEDLEEQGDPLDLMKVRQRTMPHDRLMLAATTPSAVNKHGWRRLRSGSHERPLVLCPACGGADFLNDLQVVSGAEHALTEYPAKVIAEQRLARWACRHCGALHDAAAVRGMVLDAIAVGGRWCPGVWEQTDAHPSGVWQPQADIDTAGRLLAIPPPETTVRSGWANALYSEHVTLDSFAASMVAKLHHGKPSEKKTWTNTEACRPWLYLFTPTTTDDIADAACASYAHGSAPVVAKWLVLVFDQQGNQAGRLWYPYVVRAWAAGGESWLVAAGKAMSEAERDDVEDRLYPVGSEQRAADITVKDVANPNYRPAGYLWASENPRQRLCLRGDSRLLPGETWREVPPPDPSRPTRTSRPANVHEWRIHPHYWRTELEERLHGRGPAPWHLPARDTLPDFYLKSLNAEEQALETRRVVGGGYEEMVVWRPRVTSQTDNSISTRKDEHWADCEKMQLAIVDILNLTKVEAQPGQPARAPVAEDAEPEPDTYTDGVW